MWLNFLPSAAYFGKKPGGISGYIRQYGSDHFNGLIDISASFEFRFFMSGNLAEIACDPIVIADRLPLLLGKRPPGSTAGRKISNISRLIVRVIGGDTTLEGPETVIIPDLLGKLFINFR